MSKRELDIAVWHALNIDVKRVMRCPVCKSKFDPEETDDCPKCGFDFIDGRP